MVRGMQRLFPALALLCSPAAAAERSYSIADFDRIQVEGPFEVVVATGSSTRARASGEQAALDRVSIDVQSGILKVRPNRSNWTGAGRPGPVRIEVAARMLRGATITGAGRLTVDRIRGLRVDLALSGSGTISVGAVEADNLVLGLLGSGTLNLAGRTKQLRATLQGSGDLEAAGLTADDAVLVADSAGKAAFRAVRTVKVTANGAGQVDITGGARCTVGGSGAGEVRCGK